MWNLTDACADTRLADRATGTVAVCVPPRKKVAIVGFCDNTRHLAPWTDPTYEIWGMNQGYRFFPRRADRWFEMHLPEWTPDAREPEYAKWLSEQAIPVYCLEQREDIPASIRYPLQEVINGPGCGLDYFTSTVAYALGLAILEGFEEIDIFGIDLVVEEEYFYQKACVEFWVGMALGRGVNVYIPKACALLKQSHRYGYEIADMKMGALKILYVGEVDRLKKEIGDSLNRWHTLTGALQSSEKILQLLEASERGATLIRPAPST